MSNHHYGRPGWGVAAGAPIRATDYQHRTEVSIEEQEYAQYFAASVIGDLIAAVVCAVLSAAMMAGARSEVGHMFAMNLEAWKTPFIFLLAMAFSFDAAVALTHAKAIIEQAPVDMLLSLSKWNMVSAVLSMMIWLPYKILSLADEFNVLSVVISVLILFLKGNKIRMSLKFYWLTESRCSADLEIAQDGPVRTRRSRGLLCVTLMTLATFGIFVLLVACGIKLTMLSLHRSRPEGLGRSLSTKAKPTYPGCAIFGSACALVLVWSAIGFVWNFLPVNPFSSIVDKFIGTVTNLSEKEVEARRQIVTAVLSIVVSVFGFAAGIAAGLQAEDGQRAWGAAFVACLLLAGVPLFHVLGPA